MKPKQATTIGVDVAKKTLDVALLFSDESYTSKNFSNDASGIKQLLSWVRKQGGQGCPLCVEATGGLEMKLCLMGYQAQYPIRLIPPSQIANYRKSLTLRNKTDCDDARLIARFAMTIPTVDWQPPSPKMRRLQDLLKWRRSLVQAHTALSNCASTLNDRRQQRSAITERNYMKRRITQIDASITEVIAGDVQLAKTQALLSSIPGIGAQTLALFCATIDIKTFQNAKQLSAFIGIAPMRKQSGNYEAKGRISKIGNAQLRSGLFMAALSARRHNPLLRDFADRLEQRTSLSKKQIIVACAHKLARIIYGVLKHHKPFDPNHCGSLNAEMSA